MRNLQPISPSEAVELYLTERAAEVSKQTLYAHTSRLNFFLQWCDENEIDNLNDLTGRQLYEYRIWRRGDGNLAKATLKTQMATLRVFIRWCETLDAVEPDLHIKVVSPTLSKDEASRDVMLETDQAEEIIAYLERYHYASIHHVVFVLLWHTMMRRGAARALDVEDYHPDEQYLEVKHRPETDTPLKNKEEGERLVALSPFVCKVLDDWIRDQRHPVQDEYGRNPLLTSGRGRISAGTIQKYVYAYTRPCVTTNECPHGKEIENCKAARAEGYASMCPSSVSPHAVRRGGITDWLKRDVPTRVVSDRANVSQDILDKHYDRRTEREKMEQRRQFLDND
ncbi:tyrosine-type recombinase/integrase [Haladaptatus sp. GCM10025707]|uniref:tyrosine-type recombinase/integrase n=1 Tax=unclassified Haladaptatus TaxID=2622732 RepID=UPI0023E82423|nr:site-specific integrase [Haladaptatus sp. QDMS2]